MAKGLATFTGKDFYGATPRAEVVPGLQCDIRHGHQHDQPYSYLVFLDERGVKWKIRPRLSPRGRVAGLGLFHRNRFGRAGFHSQHQSAWGTRGGWPTCLHIFGNTKITKRQGRVQ
jgi:hypothetical protein